MNSRNRKAREVRAMEEQRKSSSSGLQDGIAAQLDRAALGDAVSPELEAVAAAIRPGCWDHRASQFEPADLERMRNEARAQARRALMALREPSEGMLNALDEAVVGQQHVSTYETWTVMIDHILTNPQRAMENA